MEEESDYTDTDEEVEAGTSQNMPPVRNPAAGDGAIAVDSEEPVVVEGQGRGRYRLLIPFPVAASNADESSVSDPAETEVNASHDVESVTESQGAASVTALIQGINQTTSLENQPSSSSSTDVTDQQPAGSMPKGVEPKREIEMTEEKVETIMQVMKNITLPPTAIPNWAAEVDEDVWKKKLYDTITTKSPKVGKSNNSNSSKNEAKPEDSKEGER